MGVPLRVLAVGDPAVSAYTSGRPSFVDRWPGEVEFTVLPWAEYYPALQQALEDSNPDHDLVMVAGHLWLADFVSRGSLAPLDDLLPAADLLAELMPAVRREIRHHDRLYLVPSFTDGHLVYYRKDIVQEVLGAPLPAVLTAAGFVDAVRLCAERRPDLHALALKAHPAEIFLDWLPYLYDAGGAVFDDELRPAFNSPEGLRALETYLDLRRFCDPHTATFGNEEIMGVIHRGEAVFATSWGGQAGVIVDPRHTDPENLGYATFATPWNVTWSFALLARSPRAAEAAAFLQYLAGPEADSLVGRLAGSPCRRSTYERDAVHCPWFDAQREILERARPLPGFPGSGDVYGVLYGVLHEAFCGRITAPEALRQGEEAVLKLLTENEP